jgi:hypothetical protein
MKSSRRFCALLALAATVLAEPPRVLLLPAEQLAAMRERAARNDRAIAPALLELRREADRALAMKPPSVMDKTRTPPSGDRHDYLSQATYWWPDPSKPDGLPYIRRDGERNPEIERGTDHGPLTRMIAAVETLSLAYYLTRHEPYAAHAATLLRVWFLNPATRMNPHLQFAQFIPGVNQGRGIGIIDTHALGTVTDSAALLGGSPAWTLADNRGLRAWFEAYFTWLTTSTNGREEAGEKNNHGTWYDAQAAHLALYLGQDAWARKLLTAGLQSRIVQHVEPDGRQPLELARTKSLGYSLFNLEALLTCATLADRVGVAWWGFNSTDGRSLRAALAYVAPYTDPAKKWPHRQITSENRGRITPLLAQFLAHRDDAELRAIFSRFGPAPEEASARWRLLWPQPR